MVCSLLGLPPRYFFRSERNKITRFVATDGEGCRFGALVPPRGFRAPRFPLPLGEGGREGEGGFPTTTAAKKKPDRVFCQASCTHSVKDGIVRAAMRAPHCEHITDGGFCQASDLSDRLRLGLYRSRLAVIAGFGGTQRTADHGRRRGRNENRSALAPTPRPPPRRSEGKRALRAQPCRLRQGRGEGARGRAAEQDSTAAAEKQGRLCRSFYPCFSAAAVLQTRELGATLAATLYFSSGERAEHAGGGSAPSDGRRARLAPQRKAVHKKARGEAPGRGRRSRPGAHAKCPREVGILARLAAHTEMPEGQEHGARGGFPALPLPKRRALRCRLGSGRVSVRASAPSAHSQKIPATDHRRKADRQTVSHSPPPKAARWRHDRQQRAQPAVEGRGRASGRMCSLVPRGAFVLRASPFPLGKGDGRGKGQTDNRAENTRPLVPGAPAVCAGTAPRTVRGKSRTQRTRGRTAQEGTGANRQRTAPPIYGRAAPTITRAVRDGESDKAPTYGRRRRSGRRRARPRSRTPAPVPPQRIIFLRSAEAPDYLI